MEFIVLPADIIKMLPKSAQNALKAKLAKLEQAQVITLTKGTTAKQNTLHVVRMVTQ